MWIIVVYVGNSAVIIRLYYGYYSAAVLLRPHYFLLDINLAYLLTPFLYINLILFTYMINQMPVNTY